MKTAAASLLRPDPLGCGSDELLVGRAGLLLGCCWLEQQGLPLLSRPELWRLCDVTVGSGRQHSARTRSQFRLMYQYHGTEYLGAAHGLAGILQSLLSVPGYTQHNPAAGEEIRATLDTLLSTQTQSGNFPCATDELPPHSRESSQGPSVILMVMGALMA